MNETMKLGIVGGGVVGSATARCFMEWAEVRVYDTLPERSTHSLKEVMECDLVHVCLPTPSNEPTILHDEVQVSLPFYNLSFIDGFLESVAGSEVPLVIRSTVPVGFTHDRAGRYKLPHLIHSPEFLTARCSYVDSQLPARNIIGYPDYPLVNNYGADTYRSLLLKRFPHTPLYVMSSDESEAVKLIVNSFFAVKVGFFNEVHAFAEAMNLDWDNVMKGVLTDGRISHSHTKVPGPDGQYGFGGTCLPKDVAALACQILSQGLRADVTSGAYRRNLEDRRRNLRTEEPEVQIEVVEEIPSHDLGEPVA